MTEIREGAAQVRNLHDLRREYESAGLSEGEADDDPVRLFDRWMEEAVAAGISQANAMVAASADRRGRPSARAVLLKEYDRDGVVFYTNLESRKAGELGPGNWAALCLLWMELHRSVRIEGPVERVSDARSDRYFASRPREAQLAAVASPQSRPVADREELESLAAEAERRFAGGPVPRPSFWGGLRVRPQRFEFWQGRRHRLHDRIVYRPVGEGDGWRKERLAP